MLKALVNKMNWKSRRLGGSPVHSVYIETLHFTPLSSILFFLKVSFTGSVCQGKSPWMRPEGASVCVVLCPLPLVAILGGSTCRRFVTPRALRCSCSFLPHNFRRHFENVIPFEVPSNDRAKTWNFRAVKRMRSPSTAEYVTYTWTAPIITAVMKRLEGRHDRETIQNTLTITGQNEWGCNCLWLQRLFFR